MSYEYSENLTGLRPPPPGQDSDSSLCVNSGKTQNYSAVPRRSSGKEIYENTSINIQGSYTDDMIAPLGFEPEGSATKPNFCEGNSSLLYFISDKNGYSLFREYLRGHKQESLLDFWQSCVEFKRLANTGSSLASPKAISTYDNYLHSKHVCANILHDAVRAKLKHKLSSRQPFNETLFDNAKDCIFQYMNDIHYGKFLASDIYKRFDVSKGIQLKDRVSTKNVSRSGAKGLPPLPEEKVFEQNRGNWPCVDVHPRPLGRAGVDEREGYVPVNFSLNKAAFAGMFQQPVPPVGSANLSDVQSLSSDALTDDSKSTVTDFSERTTKSHEKRPGFQDVAGFVPRTKRLTKASKQLPPEEFIKILFEKLEKLAIEREQEERTVSNLASLGQESARGSKKSILEDAAERHQQYQLISISGYALPPKFSDSHYPIPSNTIPQHYVPMGYAEQQGIAGYCPVDTCHNPNPTWHDSEHAVEKRQCVHLGNTKKHWESSGTIESAPDSGVCVEEDLRLPRETRNRIHEWMEHSEKEVPHVPSGNYNKLRTKQPYNAAPMHGMHLAPVALDPSMPPLAPPDSRNTIEEVSRRLSQKDVREKRKSHKNRTGLSSKSSHGTCPQFPAEQNDCSSSIVSGDLHPATMYSSSSVLSSVPSTVNSKDSGLGQKNSKTQEGTKIVYYLDGEKYPYQSILPEKAVCLRQFKELIAFKKGDYRFFFKTDEEDIGTYYEEIREDDAILPCYGDKVICKVKESKHG